ncbi:MAG TPA: hypothetical protein VNB90_08405 [Cytophagaceae bacterium]|nr:hypothetical protein [Cytophagaceae bacterium]
MGTKLPRLFFQICVLLVCTLGTPSIGVCQTDSVKVYKQIRKYAAKHKFTQFLYDCFFTTPKPPLTPVTSNSKSLSNKQKKADPNAKYVGKNIREVNIEVYDPFGHSVNDTLTYPMTLLQKAGNRAHLKTRHRIIRNLLLFKKEQKLDILKITESERILRQASFVSDARIYVKPVEGSPDSVDVRVVVQDLWSIEAWGEITSVTSGSLSFEDYNLAGIGHQFYQDVSHDFSDNTTNLESNYSVNNISHTYISSNVYYRKIRDNNQIGASLNRPFYSPLAKWAGGVSVVSTWKFYNYYVKDSVEKTPTNPADSTSALGLDSVLHKAPVEYLVTDYWIGRSFNPHKSNTIDNRSRNIGVAVRYSNTQFQTRPGFDIDTGHVNLNSTLYIGSVSYSVRKFYKDKFIYRFGANEDVPEGLLIQTLYGVSVRETYKLRHYLGFEIAKGKHYEKFGYISADFVYGNYFNAGVKDDATINFTLFYFSNLLKVGRWQVRQFINFKTVYGINKTYKERISLNSIDMYGLISNPTTGTRKMFLNLETVMYTPYNIIGFRFAPLIATSMGIIDNGKGSFLYNQIYQTYGAGILFRNENLLINTFKITVAGYPYTFNGASHFKLNPSITLVLRVNGFAMGRPTPVSYQ